MRGKVGFGLETDFSKQYIKRNIIMNMIQPLFLRSGRLISGFSEDMSEKEEQALLSSFAGKSTGKSLR